MFSWHKKSRQHRIKSGIRTEFIYILQFRTKVYEIVKHKIIDFIFFANKRMYFLRNWDFSENIIMGELHFIISELYVDKSLIFNIFLNEKRI